MKTCKIVFNTEDGLVDELKSLKQMSRARIFSSTCENLDSVLPTYKGTRIYYYKTNFDDLKIGDRVVVQANNSYSVATFVGYVNTKFGTPSVTGNLKYVVGKVDFSEYEEMIQQEELLATLKAKMECRKSKLEEITVYKMLAESDSEMKQLLEEYNKLTK